MEKLTGKILPQGIGVYRWGKRLQQLQVANFMFKQAWKANDKSKILACLWLLKLEKITSHQNPHKRIIELLDNQQMDNLHASTIILLLFWCLR